MTSTSNFGVSTRENHDSSGFYDRFRAPELSMDDTVLRPVPLADPFFVGDARHMDGIDDGSVALVVTSPPYFAGKQYEEELEREGIPATYLEYLELLRDVFAESVRKLEPGGRLAVNVANLGRKPYRSLSADVIRILEDDLGLLLRGEIIWQKAQGATGSCAWGSFRSATNPVLRDLTERIVVASKGRFDRARTVKQRRAEGLPHADPMLTEDFMALTLDVWSIPPESARRVGHPAPFPVELPEQLIRLYTFENDLVLDPFMGSGSSMVAASRLGRRYAGYDLDPDYVDIARRRVAEQGVVEQRPDDSPDDETTRLLQDGRAANKVAVEVLESAGFTIDSMNKRLAKAGLSVDVIAHDLSGASWFFEIAGPFTTHHGGMARAEVVWRSLGRAHALRGVRHEEPFVLLTTALPKTSSDADRALRAAGPDAFFDAIDVLDPTARERLARYASASHTDGPIAGYWTNADLAP